MILALFLPTMPDTDPSRCLLVLLHLRRFPGPTLASAQHEEHEVSYKELRNLGITNSTLVCALDNSDLHSENHLYVGEKSGTLRSSTRSSLRVFPRLSPIFRLPSLASREVMLKCYYYPVLPLATCI